MEADGGGTHSLSLLQAQAGLVYKYLFASISPDIIV